MITILFLAANPTDTARLRLDAESRAIEIALRDTEFRDRFRLEKHYAVRIADLPGLLLRYQPDILHFSGHGLPDSAVVLEDDAGQARPVPPQVLVRLLAAAGRQIRCVVLNACYSLPQASALVEQIGCVIGMPSEVGEHGRQIRHPRRIERIHVALGDQHGRLCGLPPIRQPASKTTAISAPMLRQAWPRCLLWKFEAKPRHRRRRTGTRGCDVVGRPNMT